jgi:hypothetical protein
MAQTAKVTRPKLGFQANGIMVQPTATVTGLGTGFQAYGLSRNGQVVVGYDTGDYAAAYWSNGTVADIPGAATGGSAAYSCNADGTVIVGTNNDLPYVWEKTQSGWVSYLLPGLSSSANGQATLISADGSTIAGYIEGTPVIWTITGIAQLPGANTSTKLNAISDDGSTIAADVTGIYSEYSANINAAGNASLRIQNPGLFSIGSLGGYITLTVPNSYNPFNQTPYEDIFCLTSDGSLGFGAAYDLYSYYDLQNQTYYPETDGFWAISANAASSSNIWGLKNFEAHSCDQDGTVLAGQAVTAGYNGDQFSSYNTGNAMIAFGGKSQDMAAFLESKGVSSVDLTLTNVATNAVSEDGSVILGYGSLPAGENWVATIAAAVASFSPSLSSFAGGLSIQATVGLDYPAPTGAAVNITSNNASVIAQIVVPIAQGTMTGTATIASKAVATKTSVELTATLGASSKTITITVNPVLYPITEFTTSAGAVAGGNSVMGAIRIGGPTAAAGDVVTLKSNTAGVIVPATVTVPAGSTTATFPITSAPVTAVESVVLTATLGTSTEYAALNIIPAGVDVVRVSPAPVLGGVSTKAAVYLNGKAPAGGLKVELASSISAAQIPSSVTVAAFQTIGTVTVTTSPVSSIQTAVITAVSGSTRTDTTFIINPATFTSVTATSNPVVGGKTTSLTITMNGKAGPSGLVVTLKSSSADVVVPASVTIPAGASAASVTLSTLAVKASTPVTITATFGSATKICVVTLSP